MLNDTEKEKVTQTQEKEKMDGRRESIHLAKIGVMVFITFVCCILFFFSVLRYQGFANGWHKVISAAQPIIIGLVLAYLLNPVMKFFERHLYRLFKDRMKTDQKARKMARGIAITCSIIFLIVVIVLLIAAIVPSVINSIMGIVDTLPANVANLVKMIQEGRLGNYEAADTIGDVLTKLTDYVENWATKTLLPQARTYLIQITSGVINMVKAMFNFVIGIIVAVYVLMIKERLIGQSKKVIYAIFKPKQGNIIVETMHKADDIFGGFIIGKIIDSAIIGVICYVGCSILRIPDTMLVSVIIGGTVHWCNTGVTACSNPESMACIISVDFYYCIAAGGWKYYRTQDSWKFHRSYFFLGHVCNSDRWRNVWIPGHASWSSSICIDLLYYAQTGKSWCCKKALFSKDCGLCKSGKN